MARPAGEGEYSNLSGAEEEKDVDEKRPSASSPALRKLASPGSRRPSKAGGGNDGGGGGFGGGFGSGGGGGGGAARIVASGSGEGEDDRGNDVADETSNPIHDDVRDEDPRLTLSDHTLADDEQTGEGQINPMALSANTAFSSVVSPIAQPTKKGGSANTGQARNGWAGMQATGQRSAKKQTNSSMSSVVVDASPGAKATVLAGGTAQKSGDAAAASYGAVWAANRKAKTGLLEAKRDMFEKLERPDADLDDQLRIGDQVLLGCISNEGDPKVTRIVTADGFFTESANVVDECSYYYLATFRVTPALQYDALSESTAMQTRRDRSNTSRETVTSADETQRRPNYKRSSSSKLNLEARREIKESKEAVEDERIKNSAKLEKLEKDTKEQAKINYADDFQLLHMASGKFLTATDRGDFTVTEGGTKNSVFKAKPRYRFREDGDGVLYADEVLLTVPNFGPQMLSVTNIKIHDTGASHRSAGSEPTAGAQLVLKEQPSPDDVHVSLSGEDRNFGFRFNKVARYTYDKAVPNPVKTDRMLKLWCHEACGVLCAPHDPISDDQNAYAETSKSGEPATMDSEELAYFATSIWQLEEEHPATGSIVYWEKSYRLRHSLSLRYLSIGEKLAVGADTKLEADATVYYKAALISADDMEKEKEKLEKDSTLFKFKNTETLQNRVMNLDDCTFRMFNERKMDSSAGKTVIQKCYLHFQKMGFQLNEDGDKQIHMCFQTKEATEDTFHVLPPDATFQNHLRTLRAFQNGVPEAKMYITAFEALEGASIDDEPMEREAEQEKRREMDIEELRHFLVKNESMLKQVKIMLQVMITTCVESNKVLDRDMSDDEYLKLEGSSRKDFQDLARESKALEALMAMILAPINCKNETVKDIKNWYGHPEFDALRGMQDLCFKVLRVLVDGNERTELYIAKEHCALRFWPGPDFDSGLGQTEKGVPVKPCTETEKFEKLEWPWYDYAFPTKEDLDPGRGDAMHTCETWVSAIILCARHLAKAQECLSTLLSNNEELLDQFVDDDTVDNFIDNIQEKGPEHSTMDFFKAICSCKGHQILSNQELCLKKLLHDGKTRHQLMVETTVFPCEMFDYARKQISVVEGEPGFGDFKMEPEFEDFIHHYQGMPELDRIFERASEEHGGTLGLKELREAFKELHVELSRKDIKFVLDRADQDHDRSLSLNEFRLFIVTHLHPGWKIGFERTKEFARRHKELAKQPWNYSTEDLVNYQDPFVFDPKDPKAFPFRSRVKNQAFPYDDKGKERSANTAFRAPSSFLGDTNVVDVFDPNKTTPKVGDILKAKRTEDTGFETAMIVKLYGTPHQPNQIKVKFSRKGEPQEKKIDITQAKSDQIRKDVLKFDPVFLGWTGPPDQWTTGQDQLYFSPSALGLVDDFGVPYTAVKNSGALGGSEFRAWVPIERVCWVLDPKKLFMKVMLPRVFVKNDKVPNDKVLTLEDYIEEFTLKEEGDEGNVDGKTADITAADGPESAEAIQSRTKKKQRSTRYGLNYQSAIDRINRCYDDVFPHGDDDEDGMRHKIPKDVKKWCENEVELWWYEERNMAGLITGDLDKLDSKGRESFDRLEKIATYYESQIFLFAEMCLDRSYNSIYEMQRQFSYDMLVSLVGNDLLPDALRSAFTLLMLRTYIDRYPHAPIQAPSSVQVFDDKDGLAGEMVIKEVKDLNGEQLLKDPGNGKDPVTGRDGYFGILPQFHIPRDGPLSKGRVGTNMNLSSLKFLMFGISENENPCEKFYLMEEFITSFLFKLGGRQEPANEKRNRFVLSILDMVQSLVKFGFYGTYYELMDVTTPLVELLNGSNDMDSANVEAEAPEEATKKRYSMETTGNKLVMESKIAIIQSLMNLNRIRDDYRQKIIMAYFKKSLTEKEKEADVGVHCLFFPLIVADTIYDREHKKLEKARNKQPAGTGVAMEQLVKREQEVISRGGLHALEKEYNARKEEEKNQQTTAEEAEKEQNSKRKSKRRSSTHPTQEGNEVEWVLSSYCQQVINDIFEEFENEPKGLFSKVNQKNCFRGRGQEEVESESKGFFSGSTFEAHDYAKLDLESMSPSEDLVAICMDMMMYDSPELFESAFWLLWSQFAQREPVIEALQDVMLLESPRLYQNNKLLVVQWLVEVGSDPDAIRGSDTADLWASRCTMGHVKHLKSFKQLLRRGVEAYELWGHHDDNESHFHTAYNDSASEAYSVIHEVDETTVKTNAKERSEKYEWYLKNMAYITLFMKFMTSEESDQSTVTDFRHTIDLPMETFWTTKAGEEAKTTGTFKRYVSPDQKRHILDVEKELKEIELDGEIMDEIEKEEHKIDETKMVQLALLDPLTRNVNRLHQKIMFGFQIHEVLLSVLDIPIHKGSSANTYRCLRQIVALALGALRLFVLQNQKNQNEIYGSIDVILKVIVNNCKGCDKDDDGEDDDKTDGTKGSDSTGGSAKNPRAGGDNQQHPLDKPAPPKKSVKWDLDGWDYCGVDLIDMVEAYAVDLICEIFVENPDLCDRAAEHHALFDTMRELCLKRLPDLRALRALRFFHILSAYGNSDTKSRIVQILTEQMSDIENPLTSKYLPSTNGKQHLAGANDDDLNFQAMLISTFAFCCSDSSIWSSHAEPEDDSEPDDVYTSTKNQVQGFVSLDQIFQAVWNHGQVLYDLKWNKGNGPLLDFSRMNLYEAGFLEHELKATTGAQSFLFTDEEIKAAGFGDDEATEESHWLDPWATKQKIWEAWCDTASDAELQLQSSFLRLLTSLYLNNKVLPPKLETDRGNPLPEFVNFLLCETFTFDMAENEDLHGLGTIRKARMSGAVLPLLYAYFKTVHPKNDHAGSNLKDLDKQTTDEPQSHGISPIDALRKLAKAAKPDADPHEVVQSNLPVPEFLEIRRPGTPEVPQTLATNSGLAILMYHKCYRKSTPKPVATLALNKTSSGNKKETRQQRSQTTESRKVASGDNVFRDGVFGHRLVEKHLALELLIERMKEEEDVLFVSEAKADILNEQRKALDMKPVPDKTRVHLLSFLVFEVQKLELAPRYPKDKKYDRKKHDFHGRETTNLKGGCMKGGYEDKGEKYGWINPQSPKYEEFLQKMIDHVKDFLNKEVNSGYDTPTINIRIMKVLKLLLEDCDPDAEDDENVQLDEAALDKRKEEREQYSDKQLKFGDLGAISLVIDVISDCDPKDQDTLCAALELGTQLLNGGNENVQNLIIEHFKKNLKDGHEFFLKIKEHLEGIGKTMKLQPLFIKEYEKGDSNNPTSVFGDKITLIFGFLQLWAEGHNRKMQEFLLRQDSTTVALKKSTNVISLVVRVFDILTADADALIHSSNSGLELLEKNMAFIVEVMQGPCTAVQDFIVNDTAIVVYAKRVITMVQKRCDAPILSAKTDEDINVRKILMHTLIKAIQLITSLMEGRGGDEDRKVYNEVLDSMNSHIFKSHITKVYKWKTYVEKRKQTEAEKKLRNTLRGSIGYGILDFCWRKYTGSSRTTDQKETGKPEMKPLAWIDQYIDENNDNELKLKRLEKVLKLAEESAVELYTVFMQLASINDTMRKEVTSVDNDFQKAHSYFDENIKSIEFIWSGDMAPPGSDGKVDRLYFQLPPSSKALTAASKRKLEQEVDMDSAENKKRDFLSKSKDLVAEMQRLDQISKNVYFRLIQQNIEEIRNWTFSVSVSLNVLLALSVSGGGNSGFDNRFPEGYDYSNVHIRMGAPRHLFIVLCVLVILGYSLCFFYQMLIRAPLIRANYLRKRKQKVDKEDLDDDDDDDDDKNQNKDNRDKNPNGGKNQEPKKGDNSCSICFCCRCCCGDKGAAEVSKLDKAAHEAAAIASKQFKEALGKLAGNQKLRRYIWKLIKVWFPFIKAVAGLMVLVVIISFTPSAPTRSPAEWKWIIIAVFLATINVFFPTLMNFINELKEFPELDKITFGAYNYFVKGFEEFGAIYTAMTELENLVPFVMMYFAIHGVFRFYMCSLLLLDVIFLNERLKNVIRAVTYTATDLAVTFILMAFVVFIFTSFGMYEFGEMIWFESDEFQAVEMDDKSERNGGFPKGVIHSRDDDSVAFSLCPNLAVCFLEFFDAGLRSGDIVDAAFDDLTYQDNMMAYFGRIVFGLSFFLVIGVILFDIVTGIIIDKFGELREITAARLDKIKNSTFIADIDRSTCDENGLDFEDINTRDQDMWNYVYLMAYLEFKDEDEYTGAESMVNDAIKKSEISWMPQKMCWKMQLNDISADLEESDDLITQAKEDIISDTETRLGDFGAHKNLMEFLKEKFGDVAENMKKVDELSENMKKVDGLLTRMEALENAMPSEPLPHY